MRRDHDSHVPLRSRCEFCQFVRSILPRVPEIAGTELAMRNQRNHTYRVRPSIGGPPVLTSTVNRRERTITLHGNGADATVDVVVARALWIIISEAIYEKRSLDPDGPTLVLECDPGTGRASTMRRDGW